MDIDKLILELRSEKMRLDKVIAALEELERRDARVNNASLRTRGEPKPKPDVEPE
ncbi:MAG: hypothetical protein JO323_05085 [Acidobacteriia bacterium]|nr:hypothetical protein [Terriglobia bacterium]